jgi:excisionase family DNA binding protein
LRHRRASDWMGLGEASRLLGVAPGTLRRWSDSGSVPAFTTPGGHRRYRRTALERLIPADAARPTLARSGMTTSRLVRAYRHEARAAARAAPWIGALDDQHREWFRIHGRQLAEALLGYLDAAEAATAEKSLDTATAGAAEYGRLAARLGVSLGQAVEGFLHFRRPFLHQLALVARRRGFDVAATTDLLEAAERAMDQMLVAAMGAHGARAGGRRRLADMGAEGK